VTIHVWSTDDPGVAGECSYPVGKARNSIQCHIKKREREERERSKKEKMRERGRGERGGGGTIFLLTFIL